MAGVFEYFEHRSIFITGATGFVGRVLLEKLLRSCNGIKHIYILIRPSRGKSPEERLKQLFQGSIFDQLRKDQQEILFEKVVAIPGDVCEDRLGISQEHEKLLLQNVSVIFHSAATVKFHEPLTFALKMNLEGTRKVLNLSSRMQQLSSFVYISTAYSNADLDGIPIDEVVYPASFDPESAFDFFSRIEELKILESITPDLLGEKPNTYVLSKNLTENLVQMEGIKHNLPVCIVRPSIVGPIFSDSIQLQGWVDNLNGAASMMFVVGHGVNYISIGDPKINIDVVPVDCVAKITILAAWETGRLGNRIKVEPSGYLTENSQCRVYNACIDHFNPVTQEKWNKCVLQAVCKTPFSRLIRPPSVKITTGSWCYILNFLVLGIPCIVLDCVSVLRCQKPRLRKMFVKAENGCKAYGFFKTKSIAFKSDNVKHLIAKIPEYEKQIFDPEMEKLSWEDYTQKGVLGIRRYIDKEDDSTIPAAIKNLARLRWITLFFNIFIVLGIVFLLCGPLFIALFVFDI